MKLVVLVLSSLLATVVEVAAIVAVALVAPHASALLTLLPILAITVFVFGPILLGSMSFYFDFGSSPGSRRYLRTYLIVLLGLEALGVVAVVVFAVIAGAPVWLPVALAALAAALTALAPLIGRSLRRYDDKHGKGAPTWSPVEPGAIRRKVVKIVATFGIALIASFALFTALGIGSGRADNLGEAISLAVQFAFIAAAFAAILVSLSLARAMRAAAGRDPSLIRKVAKVVLRGKKIELTEPEQRAAAKYAPAAAVYLPFLLTYVALLYAGLAIQQVRSIVDDRSGDTAFDWGLIAFLVVVLVVFFPMYSVRTRRARRYAEAHVDLTFDGEADSARNDGAVVDPR